MFFRKRQINEKRYIDYILEDVPLGMYEFYELDQTLDFSNSQMRMHLLGREEGAIENKVISDAVKSVYFLTVLISVAELSNIKIPEDLNLYHHMLVGRAWGTTPERVYKNGIRWVVNREESKINAVKAIIKNKYDSISDYQKNQLLTFVQTAFPAINSFEDAKAIIYVANELTIKPA